MKNAFLHGHLNETVYCQQPPGFVDPAAPDHVCLLQKSLYGLKQAPRAWHQRFSGFIQRSGFTASTSDTSLFVYKAGADIAYLLLYVDIILTASSTPLLRRITELLHSEFAMISGIFITSSGSLSRILLTVSSCHSASMLWICSSAPAWLSVIPPRLLLTLMPSSLLQPAHRWRMPLSTAASPVRYSISR